MRPPKRLRTTSRRSPGSRVTADEGGRRWNEASLALSSAAEWVRGADNKAGFALTALTLLLGAMSSDLIGLRSFCSQPSWGLVVLLTSLVGVLVALLSSALVVLPRTPSPAPNRFSWPWLSDVGESDVMDRVSRGPGVDEAWAQARTLAKIARLKYQWLRVTMVSGGVAAVSFVVWKVLIQGP